MPCATCAEITKAGLRCLDERDFTGVVEVSTRRWQSTDPAVRVTPNLTVEYPDGTVNAITLHLLGPCGRDADCV